MDDEGDASELKRHLGVHARHQAIHFRRNALILVEPRLHQFVTVGAYPDG